MNLTERDRKIAIAIVPLLLLAAYWFLMLAPKRDAAAEASKELTKQTERRDTARAAASSARGDQTDFAADYAEIVRLGKAIPSSVDMPSLLVQLDRAAEGTDIRFTKVAEGQRTETAPASTAPTTDNSTSAPSSGAPVEAGGATAQSAPGSAVESANNTAQTASTQADAASQSGVDTTTSTSN